MWYHRDKKVKCKRSAREEDEEGRELVRALLMPFGASKTQASGTSSRGGWQGGDDRKVNTGT